MLGGIIKEFLVRIGYTVDAASEARFIRSVEDAGKVAAGLGAALTATAVAGVVAIQKLSNAMEQFYFMSVRTNASVQGIKSLSFAAQQLGVSAEEMQGSIEGLGRFLRTNPLAQRFIEGRLGVNTRNADGSKKDTAQILAESATRLKEMPLYIANATAGIAGISENTVLALRQGADGYLQYYNDLVHKVGVDEQAAANASHAFMVQWRNGLAIVQVLSDKVLELIGPRLAQNKGAALKMIMNHFTQISVAIAKTIDYLFSFAATIERAVIRGIQMLDALAGEFEALPKYLQLIIEGLAALGVSLLVFGWPVTLVMALGAAILALYDDYKVWQEGGKHLINWKLWIDDFNIVKNFMIGWWQDLKDLIRNNVYGIRTILQVLTGFTVVIYNNWRGILTFYQNLWGHIKDVFRDAWDYISPILNRIKDAVKWITDSRVGRLVIGGMEKAAGVAEGAAAEVGNAVAPWAKKAQGWMDKQYRDVFGNGAMSGDAGGPRDDGHSSDLSDTPSGAGTGVGKGDSKAAFAYWKSVGFGDAGAAAMAAMETSESGGNPNAVGDSGLAHGLFQWHPDRRAAILAKTGIDVDHASAAEQRRAMFLEMKDGIDVYAGKAYDALRTGIDPAAAGALATKFVERPRALEEAERNRGAMAAQYAAQYGGTVTTVHQDNTYNIAGPDPHATAGLVKQNQDASHAQLTRQLRGVVV
jgi:hypothetical protein